MLTKEELPAYDVATTVVSEMGESMRPILDAMEKWGKLYNETILKFTKGNIL